MKPMIRLSVFTLALGALWLSARANDTAHAPPAWETVASFACLPPATVDALATDAHGNLYAAITSSDDDRWMRAQVRRSTDSGATWTIVEDLVPGHSGSVQFRSLASDPAGHLYTAGYLSDDQGQYRWIVRKSSADGKTWSTVDDFALSGSQRAVAQALTVDAAGRIYAVGYADEPSVANQTHARTRWLVRQSRDGGRTWSTMDDFNHGFSAKANAILSTPTGLWVAGSGWNGDPESSERWLVRKATPDAAGQLQWDTVDEFQLQELGQTFGAQAHGLGVDAQGNVYAVGRGYAGGNGGNSVHWVVRRASRTGTDWALVDTFQLQAGNFAAAIGVASANQGGVYVVGRATAQRSGSHWIVRHSATGEAGSWSVSDNFTGKAAMAMLMDTDVIVRAPDGSKSSPAAAFAHGSAIMSGSTGVFTGGSIRAETNRALVRKLTPVNPTKLAATAGQ
jgi:hypothetical protein